MPDCCVSLTERLPPVFESWEEDRRNFLSSVTSGFLFSVGWWIMIDAACMYPLNSELGHVYHLCGVFATVAMFMVNTVSNAQITGDAYEGGCLGGFGAKIWFFVGLMMSFGSLLGAAWVLFGRYVVPGAAPVYPGVAVFLQNVFIFVASLLFKFGRAASDTWG